MYRDVCGEPINVGDYVYCDGVVVKVVESFSAEYFRVQTVATQYHRFGNVSKMLKLTNEQVQFVLYKFGENNATK